jgi:hypothetical protein
MRVTSGEDPGIGRRRIRQWKNRSDSQTENTG